MMRSSRLAMAFQPMLPPETPPPATELQAWITPPAYTRLAPIFLKPDSGTVSVPAGARLTISVTGGTSTPDAGAGRSVGPVSGLGPGKLSRRTAT